MTTRRNFLKTSALGTGAIAMPSSLFADRFSKEQPKRFIFIRKSNGIRPNEVTPLTFSDQEKSLDKQGQPFEADLENHELPVWLQPLTAHKKDMTILQGEGHRLRSVRRRTGCDHGVKWLWQVDSSERFRTSGRFRRGFLPVGWPEDEWLD